MMNKTIFTEEDLLSRTGVAKATLDSWVKGKLVRAAGFADDGTPLFSEETVSRLENVLKLQELGYGLEEIQKIVKKIGLPRTPQNSVNNSELEKYLTVGNLAEKAGVSPRTIKHWEDKGIIDPDMRTEGGFRLYSKGYVHLCMLIQDLQLFGYTLEEIKLISDQFRDFLAFQERLEAFAAREVEPKLETMLEGLQALSDKMRLFREGMERWEELMKKNLSSMKTVR